MTKDELPEGWIRTTVGEVSAAIQYGHTASAQHGKPGPRFLRITDIQNGQVDWDYVPTCDVSESELKKYGLRAGDIVFARTGATTGKSYLIRMCPESVFASYLIRLRCIAAIQPEFLSLFFQTSTYWQLISENVSGNAQPNCNASKLAELDIPLPPLAEQRRIVAAVERILDKVNAARARLDRVPTTLKRFRQAVLAAACSGRLTADWREKNPQTGTTTELLAKLNISPDTEGPDELPATWQWVKFGSVLSEFKNGLSTKPSQSPPGVPILRINAVRPGEVSFDDLRYLDCSEFQKAEYSIRDSDLLFTRYNGSLDLLGVCGMVRGVNGRNMLYPDKLMRARIASSDVLPEYCELFFGSPNARERMVGKSRSSAGQNGISGTDVKGQSLALPPLAEQQEIVRRVSAMFARADALEAKVAAARKRVDTLTQAVLAKAFRGELVPTEAELARRENRPYESASELLGRVRTSAITATPKPKRTRKKSGD